MVVTSAFVFKNKTKMVWDALIQLILVYITKLNIFQGDWTNISTETKILVGAQCNLTHINDGFKHARFTPK